MAAAWAKARMAHGMEIVHARRLRPHDLSEIMLEAEREEEDDGVVVGLLVGLLVGLRAVLAVVVVVVVPPPPPP